MIDAAALHVIQVVWGDSGQVWERVLVVRCGRGCKWSVLTAGRAVSGAAGVPHNTGRERRLSLSVLPGTTDDGNKVESLGKT